MVLGVADDLDIDGVVLSSIEVGERIWGGSLDAHVCAVYCADGVGQTSNGMEGSLHWDLFLVSVWKPDVLWDQLDDSIHNLLETAADG